MTPQQTPQDSPTPVAADTSVAPTEGGSHWLGAIVAVIVSLLLYLPTIGSQLVYDDLFLISPDLNASMVPVVEDIGAAFDLFGQEYWANVNPDQAPELRTRGQALYRPLTLFAWAVTLHTWHDQKPGMPFDATKGAPFHWLSVIVNMLVVLGLHRLTLRLFGSGRLAFLAAMIYALHPLHSEAVAYVAGLSDQLAALTVVMGLLCFERATRGQGVRPLATVGLILTFFVGMLAKESSVLLLAGCALTDFMWALRGRAVGLARRVVLYGSMLAALGAHIWIRYLAVGYLKPDTKLISRLDNVLIDADTNVRVLNSFKLLAKYVWLVLWPKDLSIDYSFSTITVSPDWMSPEPLAGTILMGAMLLLGLVKLKRSPALGWGLLFFVGCSVFTSNMFVPIGTVFGERLMYLPTMGAAVALAVVANALLGSAKSARVNPVGLMLIVVALGLLGMRTWERNKDFRNSLTLFESAKEVSPTSARVRYQLGTLYANQKLYGEAIEEIHKALAIDNTLIPAAIRLGDVHMMDRNYDKAEQAYTDILSGIRESDSLPTSLAAVRSMVLRKRGEARQAKGDLDGAQADLEQAMQFDVDETPTAAAQLAALLQGQERYAESIPIIRRGLALEATNGSLLGLLARGAAASQDEEAYEEALNLLEATEAGRPVALAMRAEVMYEQATAEQDQAKRDRAMAMFEEALEANSRAATPYIYRGRYMIEKSRAFFDAIVQYDNALEIDPRSRPALIYKADAQLKVNDPEGALETLRVLETVDPSVACYALMSEAYFKLGDLDGQEEVKRKLEGLGKEPLAMTINRAVSFHAAGDDTRAREILELELTNPESAANSQLLRTYAVLMLDLGQCDEALAYLQQQANTEATTRDAEPDAFLPINRARAYTCLGRYAEAAAELAAVEARLPSLNEQPALQRALHGSLLYRRAQMQLAMGDGAAAATTAAEAIEATSRGYPQAFDVSIEALAAQGDLEGASLRCREAETLFFKLEHYPLMLTALEQAQSGDRAAAVALLEGFAGQALYADGPAACQALAARLGG